MIENISTALPPWFMRWCPLLKVSKSQEWERGAQSYCRGASGYKQKSV